MRHKLYERLGKFVIKKRDLDELPDWVQQLMMRVIVVHADYSHIDDGVEYTAMSPEFDLYRENTMCRKYQPVVEDGRFLRWQ